MTKALATWVFFSCSWTQSQWSCHEEGESVAKNDFAWAPLPFPRDNLQFCRNLCLPLTCLAAVRAEATLGCRTGPRATATNASSLFPPPCSDRLMPEAASLRSPSPTLSIAAICTFLLALVKKSKRVFFKRQVLRGTWESGFLLWTEVLCLKLTRCCWSLPATPFYDLTTLIPWS